MNGGSVLLQIDGLNKFFGLTHANKDIHLCLEKGEVRGLAGENGSGKSTLLSQIAGIYPLDSGEMLLGGQPYRPGSPLEANEKRISIVVQELGVVNNLPVGVNIFLGRTRQFERFRVVSLKKVYTAAEEQLEKWGLPGLPLRQLAGGLTVETRKMIELARALSIDPEILILDEVTQALSLNNRKRLYELIERFKSMGRTVLLITHDVEEMIRITDSVTVLRDGEVVGTHASAGLATDRLKAMMVGRELSGAYYREDTQPSHEPEVVLQGRCMTTASLHGISFEAHRGEILGFCGLSDSGIHSVGKAIFGLERLTSGSVFLTTRNVGIDNPMTARKNGMAYVPKDRDREALMMQASIRDNFCLPSLDALESPLRYIGTRKLNGLAQNGSHMFNVKSTGIMQGINGLSGGNKQKVNLGRWLLKDLEVLVLDCPTRGVDVGVKAYIYRLMQEAKRNGTVMILISDELSEVLGMADRLLVMKDGRIAGVIDRGDDFTEEKVVEVMI